MACSDLASIASSFQVIRSGSVILWPAALAWLPVLAGGELLQPRVGGLRARWSSVFPLGLYAAASYAIASSHGSPAVRDLANVMTWVAPAAWFAVAVAPLRNA